MSRAFVNEDADGPEPRFDLPPRDDPDYDAAAAWVLIQAANEGLTHPAQLATGYRWGDERLRPHVEAILADATKAGDERLQELAERFLARAKRRQDGG